ncbi:EamA family transporter [Cohnella soli]|uniref:EamA family transporter n=1 Tax=Cohnella soli TaxID=425005 RepID=A0ABW0HYX3_9BACL
MMAPILMLSLNILLLLTGQTLWKIGLDRSGGLHISNALQVLASPWIMAGAGMYAVATVLWLAVLSRMPLSMAYPMQSMAYVLGLLIAWLIFGEIIPPNRWIGAGIIVAGVIVISMK